MRRRGFLVGVAGSLGGLQAFKGRTAAAPDALHILRGDNLDRLRLDFNASRSKVRLIVLLSPT